jgi:hypothetical protein
VKSDRSAQVSQFGEHCVTHCTDVHSQSEDSISVTWPIFWPISKEKLPKQGELCGIEPPTMMGDASQEAWETGQKKP